MAAAQQGYRLERIYGLPTRRVMLGQALVGYLYRPRGGETDWEIWPPIGAPNLWHPTAGYAPRKFASENEVLAFLGLSAPTMQVAA